MKKVMNTSIIYFIIAMASGVFYRDFTKFNNFNGQTVLAVLHTHLLVLGTAVFLFIALLYKMTDLEHNRLYKYFYPIYNISFGLMIIMMTVRGVLQVKAVELSHGMDAMISGMAGLSHIGIMIAVLLLLFGIKKELLK
ncbi:DUF2871 domain-containing protein [Lactococcus fujiensis]|uniref:DUF2871 domain-containing protein n=1 Tax=Lactococcus fujiensis JCM 16395 TaxID=1291764 RepID=A0A2A5RQ27_9LACT|nr:DUF2871 domain-containing protein [Lactococcus fujiensis]PCS01526.1 hypothetical protein RT41_GL000290 [Lactococcus fujiensis JCM 16395]